jgi:hypothetical protein
MDSNHSTTGTPVCNYIQILLHKVSTANIGEERNLFYHQSIL